MTGSVTGVILYITAKNIVGQTNILVKSKQYECSKFLPIEIGGFYNNGKFVPPEQVFWLQEPMERFYLDCNISCLCNGIAH